MNSLSCTEVVAHLESYRREDTSDELRLLIDEHLARCPACRRRLAHLKQISAMMTAWRPSPAPPGLLVDVAEEVSPELVGAVLDQGAERRRHRRPRQAASPMSRAQRVVNWIVVLALVFLAFAAGYRLLEWRAGLANDDHGPAMPESAQSAASDAAAERWQVVLTDAGQHRQAVLDVVAAARSMGLIEAKELVDSPPQTVLTGLSQEEARRLAERLRTAGATVQLRLADGPTP